MAWTAILAASLVNRAQLAASLAALFRQYQLGVISAAPSRQRQLGSTKAIKEPQASHTKITTPHNGRFHVSLVAPAQQAKALNKTGTHFCIPVLHRNSAN